MRIIRMLNEGHSQLRRTVLIRENEYITTVSVPLRCLPVGEATSSQLKYYIKDKCNGT